MGKLAKLVLAASLIPFTASAEILNFDDLTGAGNLGDYGKWQLQGFFYADGDADWGPYMKANSGGTRVSVSYPGGQAITTPGNEQYFYFNGAYFSAAPGDTIRYALWDGNTVVFRSPDTTMVGHHIFVPSGYSQAINYVSVVSSRGWGYAMDDIDVTLVSSVPEPAPYLFMLGGLAAVALRRRSTNSSV